MDDKENKVIKRLQILSVITLIFTIVGSIHFIGNIDYYTAKVASALLMCVYFFKAYKKDKGYFVIIALLLISFMNLWLDTPGGITWIFYRIKYCDIRPYSRIEIVCIICIISELLYTVMFFTGLRKKPLAITAIIAIIGVMITRDFYGIFAQFRWTLWYIKTLAYYISNLLFDILLIGLVVKRDIFIRDFNIKKSIMEITHKAKNNTEETCVSTEEIKLKELKERLENGLITEEEYNQKRKYIISQL